MAARRNPVPRVRPLRRQCARAQRRRDSGSPPSRGGIRAARESGFSLLEVLVAFVVLALVGTALFRLFGGAMGNAGAAEEWSRAVLVAQSRLALAAGAQPLREATDSGTEDDGRLRWETAVAAYVATDLPADVQQQAETLPTKLYRVTATVHLVDPTGRDRAVTLETTRIAAREPR